MCLKLCWEQKVKTIWIQQGAHTNLPRDWDVGMELESGGLMLAMISDSLTDLGQVTWPLWACFLVCKESIPDRTPPRYGVPVQLDVVSGCCPGFLPTSRRSEE